MSHNDYGYTTSPNLLKSDPAAVGEYSREKVPDAPLLLSHSHNDAAERACLGAVFVDNSAFYELDALFGQRGPNAFYRESGRILWRAFRDAFEALDGSLEGNPVDVITLADLLQARGQLDAIGGPSVLARLSSEIPSAANVAYYGRLVLRHAKLRELGALGVWLRDATIDSERDPDEIAGDVVGRILASVDLTTGSSRRRDTVKTDQIWQDRFEARLKGEVTGYLTGCAPFDQLIGGGLHNGRSYYLGGLTKMGKTTLALHAAAAFAFEYGGAVDWWSVEMMSEDLEDKFLGWKTGIDVEEVQRRIKREGWTDRNNRAFSDLVEARTRFMECDIQFETSGSPDVREIESAARARHARLQGSKPFMLVVDYMQNVTTGNHRQNENDRLSEVSRRLNGISKDLNCIVLVLFQFDKEAEKVWLTQRKTPRFSNLRGTSQAGNDANHLLVLHRNWRDFSDDPLNERYCEILQDLSRHGSIGKSVTLEVEPATCRFKAWEHGEPSGPRLWAQQQAAHGPKKGGPF